MAWGDIVPPQPAGYYRRKAAHARQVAEGVTTRALRPVNMISSLLTPIAPRQKVRFVARRSIQLQNNEPIKDQF